MADALDYLFGLEQFGIKFGLDNIRALTAALDHPELAYRSVHIAGTNGKGSVTAMVDAALRAAGYRSARYTSPHLTDLSERFVIGGHPVDHPTMIAAIERVRAAADRLLAGGGLEAPPTFFEATTAGAFELFREARADVAVFEVGMGGRLDATNVVRPDVTAVTSIAFDHEKYLGSTIAAIAEEKAGIIKAGVPIVVGELDPEALAVIARVAAQRGAPLVQTSAADAGPYEVGLAGTHQRSNAGVAVRVLGELNRRGLTISDDAIAAGLRRPEWPGRLDRRRLGDGRELLLDAAHNPAGAAALASYLEREMPERPPLVFGAMRDKNVDEMLRILTPVVGSMIATQASIARSLDAESLAARVRALAPQVPVIAAPSVSDALAAAWRAAPRIVIAGSIFLLGDVLREIHA